jgi:cytidylate kinase
MNRKEKFIITINRELGSGSRTVGEKLAEKLGVPFYDKALIKALEKKYNLTVEEIESLKGRSHSWWADFKRLIGMGYALSNNPNQKYSVTNEPDLLTTDEMFMTEQEILKGIAETESCVVAGRSGFYVFRNHPNHLSILIQAPKEQRIQRVMRKRNITAEEAEQIINDVDTQRENYVQKYTGTTRYDTRNYNLVIDSAGKTEEEIANIIMMYIG